MKKKYPNKKLLFVIDNLQAHKSSLILKIMEEDNVTLLYTPSNTPQFSPIENLFGVLKKDLRDYIFQTKEDTVKRINSLVFGYDKIKI